LLAYVGMFPASIVAGGFARVCRAMGSPADDGDFPVHWTHHATLMLAAGFAEGSGVWAALYTFWHDSHATIAFFVLPAVSAAVAAAVSVTRSFTWLVVPILGGGAAAVTVLVVVLLGLGP
jgi:hypothetical protein